MPPYRVSAARGDVEWRLSSSAGKRELVISRGSGGSAGKTVAYVMDGANGHVDVEITLTGKPPAVAQKKKATAKT
jgi:hypothetical protein